MDLAWLWAIIGSFLGAVVGAAIGAGRAYATKKGENLATKQDIGEITQITQRIEAEISDVVWNRQKHWELKRDVLFEAIRALGKLNKALLAFTVETQAKANLDASHRIKEFKDWNETLMDFTGAEELVCTVCERDTATAFHQVRLTADEIAMAMLHRNPDDSPTDFRERMDAATAAARKELGVDTPNRPSDAVTF